jgi:arginyl-tRNA synthetase
MLRSLRDEVDAALRAALRTADLEALADDKDLIEVNDPGETEKGALASPVAFKAASVAGAPPPEVAARIVEAHGDLPDAVVEMTVDGGYINYRVDEGRLVEATIEAARRDDYGADGTDPERVVVDLSAPNVAKPLHVGHLRNTVLGDVLATVLEERGHDVVRDNHLGDWGAQFGNLVYQFTQEGSHEELEERPIEHLLELYQAFGRREAELDDEGDEEALEALREKGREWFRRIENGDEEALSLFERFREVSVERFEQTYERLGVEFDYWLGESFYARNGWNERAIAAAREAGVVLETDDGALVIPVYPEDREHVEDPALAAVDCSLDRAREAVAAGDEDAFDEFVVVKSDGSTTYGTRDLATVEYRQAEFAPDRCLYVVGREQDRYFETFFAAARKVDYDDLAFKHVSYGMLSLPEGSMSTRKGTVVTAEEVLDRAKERALDVVAEKGRDLPPEAHDRVAEKVALATVKFAVIGTSRRKDVTFDVEEATSFDGDTGPYVQYAATRAHSILEDAGSKPASELPPPDELAFDDTDRNLVYELARFPLVLEECENKYDAAPLANYLVDLAHTFNGFYHTNRVLDAETAREERLVLTAATLSVFERGLSLMGVDTLEKM